MILMDMDIYRGQFLGVDSSAGPAGAARTALVPIVRCAFVARLRRCGTRSAPWCRSLAELAEHNKKGQAAAPLFLGRTGVPRLILEMKWSISPAAP